MDNNFFVTKVINRFSLLTLAMAFAMMLYFAYLFVWPIEVIKYEPDQNFTPKTVYHVGEQLIRKSHYTKYMPIKAEVTESFVDGIVFQLPTRTGNYPMGHHEFIDESTIIPTALPSGYYFLEATITFHVNHFRDISYHLKSNRFQVINEARDRLGLNPLSSAAP